MESAGTAEVADSLTLPEHCMEKSWHEVNNKKENWKAQQEVSRWLLKPAFLMSFDAIFFGVSYQKCHI